LKQDEEKIKTEIKNELKDESEIKEDSYQNEQSKLKKKRGRKVKQPKTEEQEQEDNEKVKEIKEENKTKEKKRGRGKAKKGSKNNLNNDDMQPHNDFQYIKQENDNTKINENEDEIDKILKQIEEKKEKTEKKKSYKKTVEVKENPEEKVEFPIKSIPKLINLDELNMNPVITNTDILLSLMEIALNSSDYEIGYLNKSKLFWEEVAKKEKFKRVFGLFKAETLRKYWRMIDEIGNYENTLEIIRKNKKALDSKDHK